MVRNAEISVCNAECPSRQVLDLIADKWTAIIIYRLAQGTKRYSQLQREISGISQKNAHPDITRLRAQWNC